MLGVRNRSRELERARLDEVLLLLLRYPRRPRLGVSALRSMTPGGGGINRMAGVAGVDGVVDSSWDALLAPRLSKDVL